MGDLCRCGGVATLVAEFARDDGVSNGEGQCGESGARICARGPRAGTVIPFCVGQKSEHTHRAGTCVRVRARLVFATTGQATQLPRTPTAPRNRRSTWRTDPVRCPNPTRRRRLRPCKVAAEPTTLPCRRLGERITPCRGWGGCAVGGSMGRERRRAPTEQTKIGLPLNLGQFLGSLGVAAQVSRRRPLAPEGVLESG